MVTHSVLLEGLSELAELYDRKRSISPFIAGVYADAVRDWSDEKFLRVCGQIAKNNKFWPKPADFIEAGGGGESDQAAEAWQRVFASISRVGSYQSIDFGSATNLAVRAIGGWIWLCQSPEEDLSHTQRRFLAAFGTAIRGGYGEHDDSLLAGLSELDTRRMGLEPPEPFRWLPGGELEHPKRQALPKELSEQVRKLHDEARLFELPSECPRSPSMASASARRRHIQKTIRMLSKKMGG